MAKRDDNELGLLQARYHGEVKAAEFGFTALPIDLLDIAGKVGIVVQAKKTTGGVSGMLLRNGDDFGILYATHIQSPGFQRFSIGHELGHYFLPGHIDAVLGDRNIHESRAGFASGDKYEMEADYFAAGLLMPQKLFTPAIRQAGEGLAAIKCLADLCKTSLTATAIRFTQCSREPVAIVVSTGNSIDYCFMSDALRDVDGIDWIRKREALPRNTPTFAFNQDSGKVRQAVQVEATSNFKDWFGGHLSIEIREDVIGLGDYGKTLTVLHEIYIPDEDEDDDEEKLVESWTPRFRR
jgi:IrrE N-terminal-like domain